MTPNLATNPVVRGTPAWARRKIVSARASTGRVRDRPRNASSDWSPSCARDTSVTTPKVPSTITA